MARRRNAIEIRPRIRLVKDGNILLGPGKADLLAAIHSTGSIRQAAAEMGMSYMRAWTLVKAMNDGFKEPLVESSRGGAGRGGATLTRTGRVVLDLYRKMQQDSLEATARTTRALERLAK